MEGNPRVATDAKGAPIGVINVFRDVTDQRKAEEALRQSEARYRFFADQATDIIACFGPDTRFTYLSPAIERILGYQPEELIGRSTRDIMHPDDYKASLQDYSAHLASEKRAEPFHFEYRAYRKDGAMVWLSGHPHAVFDQRTGEIIEFQDLVRDITERRAMEEDLIRKTEEAAAAATLKSQFLANMSHEIRTPLTAIIGYSQLLAKQAELSGLSQKHVERINSAGEALLAIVNDILDFSKLEAGEMAIRRDPASPARLIRETRDIFELQAAQKGVALVTSGEDELPANLLLDADRVRQILVNLVGNALKFTREGAVTLKSSYDWETGRLRIEVRDTGVGVAADQMTKLFQRFSQVDGSSTRKHGGTGLGLAICRALVEAMQGEVGVTSELGRGSTFFFTLPAEITSVETLPDAAESLELLAGARVLVVDDNAANRELARALLEAMSAEVVTAESGADAVAKAADAPFDAILMDLRMPELDGRGAAALIRGGDGPNQRTSILAFTADVQADLGDDGVEFDGVIGKPIIPKDLVASIAAALKRKA